MKQVVLSLDIGGTEIKGGIVTKDGVCLNKCAVATDASRGKDEVMRNLTSLAKTLHEKAEKEHARVIGVGVGTPGLVGEDATLVGGCENIPGFAGTRFADIGDIFGVPTKADNDATVASLGEAKYGAGKDARAMLLATLGTGIGGGIVIDGHVYRGATGYAGEIGHICIEPDGRPCNCGSYGCFEQYASASAMVRHAIQKLKHHSDDTALTETTLMSGKAKTIFDAAREGDLVAHEVIEETARYLGIGFSIVVNLLNVDVILVGGGVSKSADILLPLVKKHLKNNTLNLAYPAVDLRPAQLGNDAGIYGCAALHFAE